MTDVPRLYSYRDFPADRLVAAKGDHRISVCLPARNEEATVGMIVDRISAELVERAPLVDEIIVIDDGSTDGTADAAGSAGAQVVASASILPDASPGSGKGNVLWKSLYISDGDLICWLDADIRDFGPRFVTGLLGPLLTRPAVAFVKGFYRRPLDGDGRGGGRVTELVARPLISRFFPHLAPIIQPLAGEYAARRDLVERLPFVEGWGVELALLVDVAARAGVGSIAQVDLGSRKHRNRPLDELTPQAMAILETALRRAGIADRSEWAEHLVTFDRSRRVDHMPVELLERPPMVTVPAYRAKRGRELSA
jgi:glucosyl-3-phosphoglycerate synthase